MRQGTPFFAPRIGPERHTAIWYPIVGFETDEPVVDLPCPSGRLEISQIGSRDELEFLLSHYPPVDESTRDEIRRGRYWKILYCPEQQEPSPSHIVQIGDSVVAALRFFKSEFVDVVFGLWLYPDERVGHCVFSSKTPDAWERYPSYRLEPPEIPAFVNLWKTVYEIYGSALDWRAGAVLSVSMRRFSLSYGKWPGEDVYLDRWIALETLTAPGARKPRDFFTAMRLGRLLAKTVPEREEIAEQLKELKALRNKIVHEDRRCITWDSAHLERLTDILRRALLAYAKIVHQEGKRLDQINNELDNAIYYHVLGAPTNADRGIAN